MIDDDHYESQAYPGAYSVQTNPRKGGKGPVYDSACTEHLRFIEGASLRQREDNALYSSVIHLLERLRCEGKLSACYYMYRGYPLTFLAAHLQSRGVMLFGALNEFDSRRNNNSTFKKEEGKDGVTNVLEHQTTLGNRRRCFTQISGRGLALQLSAEDRCQCVICVARRNGSSSNSIGLLFFSRNLDRDVVFPMRKLRSVFVQDWIGSPVRHDSGQQHDTDMTPESVLSCGFRIRQTRCTSSHLQKEQTIGIFKCLNGL